MTDPNTWAFVECLIGAGLIGFGLGLAVGWWFPLS